MKIRWQFILRDLTTVLVIVTLLLALALWVMVSRNPRGPRLERWSEAPVVGPLVARLRSAYLPEAESQPAAAERPDLDRPGARAAPNRVFVGGGAALRAYPRRDAELLDRTRSLQQWTVLEQTGSWVRIELGPGQTRSQTDLANAWVDLDEPRDMTPLHGEEPLPPTPVTSLAPSDRRVQAALDLLSSDSTELVVAGYRVVLGFEEPVLESRLRSLVDRLEPSYAVRYGRQPIGEPREVVVIYDLESDYRALQAVEEEIDGLPSSGHASRGLVGLFRQGRNAWEVEETLLHELVHLLNRRAIGPALPPWLDEGLAEELAQHLVHDDVPGGRYTGHRTLADGRITLTGPLAGLRELRRLHNTGRLVPLEQLLELDSDEFIRSSSVGLHYEHAGHLLRYLVQEEGDGLRRFLAAVSRGQPPSGELLGAELGRPLSDVDAGFRDWLAREAVAAALDQP